MKKVVILIFLLSIHNSVNAQNTLPDYAGPKYRTFLDDILYTFTAKNYFGTLLTSFQYQENPQKAVVATVVKTEEKNRDPVADFSDNIEMKKAVQEFLGVNSDGKFGNKTVEALKDFQREKGLPETGQINTETLSKLDEEMDKGKKFELIGEGRGSTFAVSSSKQGCLADNADQQNNQKSFSGVILSRVNAQAIPAVALRGNVWDYVGGSKKGKGRIVEVLNNSTGICKSFPLLDKGPSTDAVIDLTGPAYDILTGKKPCTSVASNKGKLNTNISEVKYAVNPNPDSKLAPGQVGECEFLSKRIQVAELKK